MKAAQRGGHADSASDDSRGGLVLFMIFTAAVLIVTGAVALVALVETWWMLGLAFALHVLMTTVVVLTIASVMDGRSGEATERQRPDERRRESRPPAPRKPVAAL